MQRRTADSDALAAIGGAAEVLEVQLHGAMVDSEANAFRVLHTRLSALAHLLTPDGTLAHRELVFRTVSGVLAGSDEPVMDSEVRVRHHWREKTWRLSYRGAAIVEQTTALVRPLHESDVSENIVQFLERTCYTFRYEFIREGYYWRSPNNIVVSLTQLKKLADRNAPADSATLVSPAWLLECTALCTKEHLAPTVAQLRSFVDQLVPLVDLSRVDSRMLQPILVNARNAAHQQQREQFAAQQQQQQQQPVR